jgi:hypothetical protein
MAAPEVEPLVSRELMEDERVHLGSFLDRAAMTRMLEVEADNQENFQSKVIHFLKKN